MKVLGIVGTVFGSKTKISLNEIKFGVDTSYEIIDFDDYNIHFEDGRFLNEYDDTVINLINKIID